MAKLQTGGGLLNLLVKNITEINDGILEHIKAELAKGNPRSVSDDDDKRRPIDEEREQPRSARSDSGEPQPEQFARLFAMLREQNKQLERQNRELMRINTELSQQFELLKATMTHVDKLTKTTAECQNIREIIAEQFKKIFPYGPPPPPPPGHRPPGPPPPWR